MVIKTGKELIKPVDREFGIGIDYDSPDYIMREALKRNLWRFSVAKNDSDNARLNNLLLRPDGSLRPWNEFKREAMFVVGESNRFLKTEYDTIIAGAQMSRLWMEIQRDKHIFPFVQFDVVMDDRTSDICSPLHLVIMSVDDERLIYYFPPNHFNCRTTVRKLRNGVPTENVDLPEIPEAFQNNVGITKEIFTDKNKYIQNASEENLKTAENISQRFQRYQQLSENSSYYDVEFSDKGGLKATHKDHNHNRKTISHEKNVQDIFFENGDEITLEDESQKVVKGKKTDGILNSQTFDISTIGGEGLNNIKNALNHSKSKRAEVAVIYFPDNTLYSFERLKNGIDRFNGQTDYRFKKIIYIVNGKIYYY